MRLATSDRVWAVEQRGEYLRVTYNGRFAGEVHGEITGDGFAGLGSDALAALARLGVPVDALLAEPEAEAGDGPDPRNYLAAP